MSTALTLTPNRDCMPVKNRRIPTIPAGRFGGRLGHVSAVDTGPRLWHQLLGNILMAAAGIVCTLGALGLGAWVWWHLDGPETRWQLFGAYATGSVAVVGVTCLALSALVSLTDWGRTRRKHEARHRD